MASICGDDRFEFIDPLTEKVLEMTDMTQEDAYAFAYYVWALKDFLNEYINAKENNNGNKQF